MMSVLDLSLPTFESYGEAQGYQVVAKQLEQDGASSESPSGLRARGAKLEVIRRALEGGMKEI
jgi:hypothetical protein